MPGRGPEDRSDQTPGSAASAMPAGRPGGAGATPAGQGIGASARLAIMKKLPLPPSGLHGGGGTAWR